MLLRMAAALAMNGSPEHRWRRLAVPVSALVFMMLLLAAISVTLLAERQEERDLARGAAWEISSEPRGTDVFTKTTLDIWRGKRITITWVEPTAEGADPVRAVGMDRFPAPGQAVVSPELDRLAAHHRSLAERFPDRLLLNHHGVRSGGELIAYVRPPAGRKIGGEADALHLEGGQAVGDGRLLRVSGLSAPSGGDPPPLPLLTAALLGSVLIPGMVLLAVGFSANSRVRDRRFQVMTALGARTRTVRALGAVETLMPAVPALATATVLWGVVAPQLQTVPLAGYRIVPGDLAVPWWLLAAAFAVAVVLSVLVAITVLTLGRDSRQVRPTSRRSTGSPLALLPVVASVGAFALVSLVTAEGDLKGNLQLIGIVGAIAAAPLIVPSILARLGTVLGASPSLTLSLTGRGLAWDPKRAARPFMGLAALLVTVLTIAGIYSIGAANEAAYPSVTGVEAVKVEWIDQAPQDVARLSAALPGRLVMPYRSAAGPAGRDHGHDEHEARSLELGGTCRQLAETVRVGTCDPASPQDLPADLERVLAQALTPALQSPVEELRLIDPAQLADAGAVVVLDRSRLSPLDEEVRGAAYAILPAPLIYSDIFRQRPLPSPANGWITFGATLAFVPLSFACLIALVDRLLAAREDHRHLLNLGIPAFTLARLGATMFAVPYAVAAFVGLVTGILLASSMAAGGDLRMPWPFVGLVTGLVAALGVVGTLAVSALGTRDALSEPE